MHRSAPPPTRPAAAGDRRGFSLTELLVASSIGLLVMASVASLFGVFGGALSESQATVDLTGRMRSASWRLRQDLAGVTCPVVPWLSPDANAGYFEVVEGPRRDRDAGQGSSNIQADTDDVLMFTTECLDGPFVGRYADANRTIESRYAEIAWFCRPAVAQPVSGLTLHDLHRRQLLVLGTVGAAEFNGNSIAGVLPNNDYDISLRSEGGRLLPNTLGDLTKREHRFQHAAAFPHPATIDNPATFRNTDREWEDVILTNVVAFDVRAFDPEARAEVAGAVTRFPGDPGYNAGSGAYGAWVDLGGGQGGRLTQAADPKSRLALPTYDTWSQHYEFTAAGRSGLNDPGQYATAPPYAVPLRGVEVRIRCYDPTSRQVRQVTVRHMFRPR